MNQENDPPKLPTREALVALHQHSLRLQDALIKSIELIENEDTKNIHQQLTAAEGHVERISADLSNLRVNHTCS